MHEPDFWTHSADAMELSIEGNRLIARELTELARRFWQRITASFDGVIEGMGQHPHLPPM